MAFAQLTHDVETQTRAALRDILLLRDPRVPLSDLHQLLLWSVPKFTPPLQLLNPSATW